MAVSAVHSILLMGLLRQGKPLRASSAQQVTETVKASYACAEHARHPSVVHISTPQYPKPLLLKKPAPLSTCPGLLPVPCFPVSAMLRGFDQ